MSQPSCCHLGSVYVKRVEVGLGGGWGGSDVYVPIWQLRVIKKGCEGAIQRFLVINEEQH